MTRRKKGGGDVTPQERKWCHLVMTGMSGSKAATEVGFPESASPQAAYRMRKRKRVQRYLKKLELADESNAKEARRQILSRLWDIIDDEEVSTGNRLKAIDQVAKIYSLHVEKREVSVSGESKIQIVLPDNGRNPELSGAHGGGSVKQLEPDSAGELADGDDPVDAEFVEG